MRKGLVSLRIPFYPPDYSKFELVEHHPEVLGMLFFKATVPFF
jgi:hypothetical protein